MEWHKEEFTISDERGRLDFAFIHQCLSTQTYWATGRARGVIEKSFAHSHPFGIYQGERLVGFARVVTDYATFAWLADVFVSEEFRGRGLGKWLVEVILSHPDLQGFRRWVLATKDAHELYRQFGFDALKRPERFMERPDPHLQERPDYWEHEAAG
ncbi:GNAT family N-acetyltransferase [soil metagenome]